MQVLVVDYNPKWPQEFAQEASRLRAILGDILVNLYHIGSTSVPGLRAKPVIDMMPEVSDLTKLDSKNKQMEGLGYEVMGEYGIPGRRYFRKGGDRRTHNMHAFASGDPGIIRHLAFRDYLRAHSEIAQEYAQLKWEISQRPQLDIEQYCDAKAPFIKLHEKLALEWYASQAGTSA